MTPGAHAHVVPVLHAGGLAARAQHYISHALQRALQLHLLQVLPQGGGQQGHHHLQGPASSARSHLGVQGRQVAGCCDDADRSATAACRAAPGIARDATNSRVASTCREAPVRATCQLGVQGSPWEGACGRGQCRAGDSSRMMTCRAGATTTAGEHRRNQAGTACTPCQTAQLSGLSHQAAWPGSGGPNKTNVFWNPSVKQGNPTNRSRLLVTRQLSTL